MINSDQRTPSAEQFHEYERQNSKKFNNSYKGNMTSREAGLMVRDMVEAYEKKLKL